MLFVSLAVTSATGKSPSLSHRIVGDVSYVDVLVTFSTSHVIEDWGTPTRYANIIVARVIARLTNLQVITEARHSYSLGLLEQGEYNFTLVVCQQYSCESSSLSFVVLDSIVRGGQEVSLVAGTVGFWVAPAISVGFALRFFLKQMKKGGMVRFRWRIWSSNSAPPSPASAITG